MTDSKFKSLTVSHLDSGAMPLGGFVRERVYTMCLCEVSTQRTPDCPVCRRSSDTFPRPLEARIGLFPMFIVGGGSISD
jgi:hypothetical protein